MQRNKMEVPGSVAAEYVDEMQKKVESLLIELE